MTKYEKTLLENFDKLYGTEINGFIWNDCCDYESNIPTYFYFTNEEYNIIGYYDKGIYEVYNNEDILIKTFKTLKSAMNYVNKI